MENGQYVTKEELVSLSNEVRLLSNSFIQTNNNIVDKLHGIELEVMRFKASFETEMKHVLSSIKKSTEVQDGDGEEIEELNVRLDRMEQKASILTKVVWTIFTGLLGLSFAFLERFVIG